VAAASTPTDVSAPSDAAILECNRVAEQIASTRAGRTEDLPAVGAGPAEEERSAEPRPGSDSSGLEAGARGTTFGMSDENRHSAEAQLAYRECMASRGYSS
jgi:hypothetical protein